MACGEFLECVLVGHGVAPSTLHRGNVYLHGVYISVSKCVLGLMAMRVILVVDVTEKTEK